LIAKKLFSAGRDQEAKRSARLRTEFPCGSDSRSHFLERRAHGRVQALSGFRQSDTSRRALHERDSDALLEPP
jgi:hypothetical protein